MNNMIIANELLFRDDYKSILVVDIDKTNYIIDDFKLKVESNLYIFRPEQRFNSKNHCLIIGVGNINGSQYILMQEINSSKLYVLEPYEIAKRFQIIELK